MTTDFESLGRRLVEYCERFSVPLEHLFDILNDQKVVPMIRGKATEFMGYLLLVRLLDMSEWSVQKLNLNAQSNTDDEDISVTHRRTGIILKVECKNAVRGSMRSGKRTRIHKVPHCRIKCHRSRSNIRLAGTSNDRYSVDTFDVIITNMSNALIQPRTVGEELELLYDADTIEAVKKHYCTSEAKDILRAASDADWRFVFPKDIAEKGFIPRTPYVLLENDPNWRPLDSISKHLIALVRDRTAKAGLKRGKSRR